MVEKEKNIKIIKGPPPIDESWWEAVLTDIEKQYMSTRGANKGSLESGGEGENGGKQDGNGSQIDWKFAERLYKQDQVVQLKVCGCNRGGLLVEGENLQGFVPISHIVKIDHNLAEIEPEVALAPLVGEEIQLKVIEFDPKRGRVVFSERAAQADPGVRLKLFNQLEIGQVVRGSVTTITDFGVFVDLGGVEGLIHISELSWGRVRHPSDFLAVGDEVEACVLQLDSERSRVALSMKRLTENPWETIEHRYRPGQVTEAVITSIVPYGAFARLDEGLDGLIHITQFGIEGDFHPGDVVQEGQRVTVSILHIDAKNQRLGLSLYRKEDTAM